jgi:hypothetical protein
MLMEIGHDNRGDILQTSKYFGVSRYMYEYECMT